MSMFDETEERFDRRQPCIAGSDRVGAPFFNVFKERPDYLNIEVFDCELRRGALEPSCYKALQEGERMSIGCDGMSACSALIGEVSLQECRKVGGEQSHSAPPIQFSSAVEAISFSRTGVASRYQ